MVEAASDYLLAQGFKAVVESNLNRDELEAITSAIEQNYDGLIIHADKVDSEPLNQLMQQHPTTVMLNRHLTKFKERCVDVEIKRRRVYGGDLSQSCRCYRHFLSQR